jgi:hypothetical protein
MGLSLLNEGPGDGIKKLVSFIERITGIAKTDKVLIKDFIQTGESLSKDELKSVLNGAKGDTILQSMEWHAKTLTGSEKSEALSRIKELRALKTEVNVGDNLTKLRNKLPTPKIDVNFQVPNEIISVTNKNGVDIVGITNQVDKALGNDLSRAEKLKLELTEKMNELQIKQGEESVRFTKERNDLDLLLKEIKARTESINTELKSLEAKEKLGKITDAEKSRAVDLSNKRVDLRTKQLKLTGKIVKFLLIGLAGVLGGALFWYLKNLLCEKTSSWGFCSYFKLKGSSTGGGGSNLKQRPY